MALSQEKIDAYAALEDAIEQLRKAYDYSDDILTGWVLLTSSVKNLDEEDKDPEDDDLDLQSSFGWYTRRGQDPVLSLGIVSEGVRHYNRIQRDDGEDY